MRVYLAGYQGTDAARERRMIKAGVAKYRCLSYVNVEKVPGLPFFGKGMSAAYQQCVKSKVGIMMDSGVFSYRTYVKFLARTKKPTTTLPTPDEYTKRYVEFCLANHTKWDFCVTVDLKPDAADSYARHIAIEKMGLRTMPVFHGDSTLDWIRKYKDRGYDYVGIAAYRVKSGGMSAVRNYYDSLFELGAKIGVDYHGLAMTKPWSMLEFPWRSCDSSSWSQFAGYGLIISFNEASGRLDVLHVSDRFRACFAKAGTSLHLNKRMAENVAAFVKADGYDLAELREDHTARHIYNAASMQKLATAAEKRQGRTGGWRKLF